MRETLRIWVWLVAGVWIPSSAALTITGEVVDSQARPVAGAEVVMCEKEQIGSRDDVDARMVGPVVRTDAAGRFAFEAQVTQQRSAFIVARKPGLAYAWDWLTSSPYSTLTRVHFSLVLEPPCVLAGQVVDPTGKPVAGAQALLRCLLFEEVGEGQEFRSSIIETSRHASHETLQPAGVQVERIDVSSYVAKTAVGIEKRAGVL